MPNADAAFAVTQGVLPRAPAAVEEIQADDLDALAGLALDYRARSVRFITARAEAGHGIRQMDGALKAAETVLWFSSRIYFMTTRALVGKALTAAGQPHRDEEASISAGQTLVAVDRSREALQQLADTDDERRVLIALLDAIARGIEERFASARPRVAEERTGSRLLVPGGAIYSSRLVARSQKRQPTSQPPLIRMRAER
jgi:hypothetical protein